MFGVNYSSSNHRVVFDVNSGAFVNNTKSSLYDKDR